MSEVTIRPINPNELQAIARIKTICFQDDNEAGALAWLQGNPRHDLSHVIVAEVAGTAVGTATMYPVKMWLSGVPLTVGAIAGVAVLPEFRRQGFAAKMMEFFIQRAATEGYAMATLFPYDYLYYEKFGFGTVSDLHAYGVEPSNFIAFEEKSKVRNFAPEDLPMMRVMYKGQMTWHNGWFTRTNDWWDRIIEKWPNIAVFSNDSMIEGYFGYEIYTNQMGQQVLRVKEFFAAEGEAFRGLVGYLASRTDVQVIEYLAPADTPFRHSMLRPRAASAQNRGWVFNDLCHVTAGPMARIITLPTALTKRFYARHMLGERIIKLTDPLIPANEEPLVFRLVDGRAETHPASPGRKPQIETDIRTFTQILCGYLTAANAQRLGRLMANEDACSWLDKAVADSPLYIQPGDWF